MKKLVILGAGTAGTMAANRLARVLNMNEWQMTLVDQDPVHYYQPGYLFLPFGINTEKQIVRPKSNFVPRGAKLIQSSIEIIEPDQNRVKLGNGDVLDYDFLIIATGTDIHPEETPGMTEHEWGKSIQTFYTFEGTQALTRKLSSWEGGRLVVNVVEMPIKCPVAPLEFLLLADWHFHKLGMREKVELVYATPLSGAFTKPIAAMKLGEILAERNIIVESDFYIERVDPDNKKLVSYDEREVDFDLLVSIPLNKGADVIARSGLAGELNYVPVDQHTFQSNQYENIFVLGDASNIPTSKAGSVAHFSVDLFSENFLNLLEGKPMEHKFDGHANCFIESGFNKGVLIDFNYDTEPLPGTYPIPGIGPMKLLEETVLNHWGKLGFRLLYWEILLRGYKLPLPPRMSMAGKHVN